MSTTFLKKFTMEIKTSKRLAEYLECSEATVIKWRKAGLPYEPHGLGYKYDLEAVLRWLSVKSDRHRGWVERLSERLA